MRLFAAVTAAAVLSLATPAAAQPDPGRIMHGAIEQLLLNVPAEVRDYTMTISSGPVRSELYVYRFQDGWGTEIPYDASLAELFESMVVWPNLSTAYRPDLAPARASAALANVRYLGRDSLEGRVVHVLAARVPGLSLGGMEIPDSAHVFVDAETRQVLRVATSTNLEPSGGLLANGGRLDLAVTFGGYETAGGVTLPRRMHVRLRISGKLSDVERAEMRQEAEATLAEPASDDTLEMRLMAEMTLRVLNGEPVEVLAVVEEVRVNAGPPAWSDRSR
jgi:hypothetical protein